LLVGAKTVFTGDLLFAGSVGRTDFPGSSHQQLLQSLRRLYTLLPLDTLVLPGHGPETTLAHEKQTNPFVQEALANRDQNHAA
jgi:glyoxylase-like metal-dependent hydrolase (beta-lactamase superfamily II)